MAHVRSMMLFFAAALAAGTAMAEPSRVRALNTCPRSASGCVEMAMHWDFARTDKPPIDRDGLLAVRGRLEKGEVEPYRLALAGASGLDLGDVAYIGRSRDGRPTILTDKGALAIETRGVHVGRGGAIVIINTRTKAVKREYLGGLVNGTFVVVTAAKIGVVTKSGSCLSPPTATPGALKEVAVCGSVSRLPLAGFSERVAGAITPAPDADLALIRKLLPQTADLDDETLHLKIGRIDKNTLIVTPW